MDFQAGAQNVEYPKMGETRRDMIILDTWIKMAWNGRIIPNYQALGYVYTGRFDTFWCHINDLSRGSRVKVLVQCSVCKKKRMAVYQNIALDQHTICNGCSSIKDLAGITFGRWTAIEIDRDHRAETGNINWLCKCECGVSGSVSGHSLIRGRSTSCGCYHSEVVSGKNNWNFNHTLTDADRSASRASPEYAQWVKGVFSRDDYTCQVCGQRGGQLEAHHLYSYTAYPEHKHDIDNGITLCQEHHASFHSWMGGKRVPCAPNDFYNWMHVLSFSNELACSSS